MKKILIVDDNQNLVAYMEKKLRDAGHEVVTESDGLSAIRKLVDYTPDVVFTDYFLPTINGDTLCRIIRKMDHLNNTYLVLMSAAAKELHLDPSSVCADSFIAKGVFKETIQHFLSAIEDAGKLRSQGGQRPPDEQKPGVIGIESIPSPADDGGAPGEVSPSSNDPRQHLRRDSRDLPRTDRLVSTLLPSQSSAWTSMNFWPPVSRLCLRRLNGPKSNQC